MTSPLTLDVIRTALTNRAAAFRRVTCFQPAGGPGDKVFPPTYEGGKYATETRHIDGRDLDCVLMDSVQSQANRMEQALLDAHRDGLIELPLVTTRFDQAGLKKQFTVTSLDAPHRVADALFRDSLLDGIMFRYSKKGRILDYADVRNATGLFGLNPAALVFGLWDSTGPRGGLGAKFQRALVSEMVGLDAVAGVKTSSRIDPAQIMLGSGPLHHRKADDGTKPEWTLDAKAGGKKLGKDGKPSEANHGNVTPSIDAGGFTISEAMQTTVLSLTCLRRLRFPLNGGPDSDPDTDVAARTALATLGLAAATLGHEQMTDLRSRCQLFPTGAAPWQLLADPEAEPERFSLTPIQAAELLQEAVAAARAAGLPWEGEIRLTPSEELVELVRRSQELAAAEGEGAE
ncbi:type I-U CRISPR-associated protein Cas7 [Thiohalocapsa halophila]|uniref:Type I-U CRISPR-associated protein Cas7 n=1 Tax=Thiohalocapsa halophila TaxID=69359 RepID=A0ABS1CL16_9GAMM|nr:type I-U CRISPR-associated RAMP protein Csb1/Cas7u [Thiohalocapsa halophila]MBK1632154.1 type I-U CRISPR-associated protein Cas7 [Thiohalocapsa halophila]